MGSAMVCCNHSHSPCRGTDKHQGNSKPTPSNHRTQLGPVASNSSRLGAGGFRNAASTAARGLQSQTPAHQQSFAGLNANTLSRPSMSGYGLSAGLKVGRQTSWSLFRSLRVWNRPHSTLLMNNRSSSRSTQSRPPSFESARPFSRRWRCLLLIPSVKGIFLSSAYFPCGVYGSTMYESSAAVNSCVI